jgi:hypothetical protein
MSWWAQGRNVPILLDYAGVEAFLPKADQMDPQLKQDLEGLASADIPTDIVFKQGMDVLQAAAAERK